MLAGSPDHHPPPADLDVPAARAAEAHYKEALRRGLREDTAWAEAVETFRLHHSAWPLPLAEREAARIVGALIGRNRAAAEGTRVHPTPPLPLLLHLANPSRAVPWGSPCAAPLLLRPPGVHGVPAGTPRAPLPATCAGPRRTSPRPRPAPEPHRE